MSCIAPAILDTVLGHLALLFTSGADGDANASRAAANQMLAAYDVQTEEELCLAAGIISFGFHALEALSQAAEPGLSLNRILRLRGSAVSLSREGHKSQRKLDALRRARQGAAEATQAKPETEVAAIAAGATKTATKTATGPTEAQVDKAIGLIQFAHEAIESASKGNGQGNGQGNGKTWTQQYQQRQTARRLVEKIQKNQARQAASPAALGPVPAAPIPAAAVR